MQRPTKSNEQRLDEIEEAFMLFASMIARQTSDATESENIAAQRRFAEVMDSIRSRHV